MISAVVASANQQYTQDPDGWIEVLKVEDSILTVVFAFIEETLLKQLQFEGKLSVLHQEFTIHIRTSCCTSYALVCNYYCNV